jgi:hypothetical protein
MDLIGRTLLIPRPPDGERDAVAAAWEHQGGLVLRIDRFWDPPAIDTTRLSVYGNETFCLVLQQKLGLDLVTPPDDLLLSVPEAWIRRRIVRRGLEQAMALEFPVFVKPVAPKLFRARVYESPSELAVECAGLATDTAVFAAEIVSFAAEARCFVLDGHVLDCSIYEGCGDTAAAAEAARAIGAAISAPETYVLDVGLIAGRGWAIVELNAAWGSGLNGCDSRRVLPAIARASRLEFGR